MDNKEFELYEVLEKILGEKYAEEMTMSSLFLDDLELSAWDIAEIVYMLETTGNVRLPDYHGREYDDDLWEGVTVGEVIRAAAESLREIEASMGSAAFL